ncbi:hypothetical protein [Arsenicibacter rosenii]|uniref:Transporter n=1 Tax=Arsenicibacter rosenii TaxID=1750698 RepID=A0A1S2VKZ6_9BACT|nr:hypothetical protein [Arsenicibacter rosenii]OIN59441.1 hypothetical protein BLX24_10750 [Arsenicibacter rosenii]
MKKLIITLVVACGLAGTAKAQMPQDAIYMPKKTVCAALMYGHSSWKEYWEHTLKRENYNIGTLTTQSVSLMAAAGITNRFNIIANLPYVKTDASAGNLMGQKGFQDVSAWLKYKVVDLKGFSVNALAGGSLPVSKYVPDFMPMSIGMQCRTASGRLLLNYTHPKTGLYVTTHGTLTWRSNISVDRDAYKSGDKVYNTREVNVPNTYDIAARLGILRKKWQTEVWGEHGACLSGDYIARNDMPFPTNNMQATTIGWYGKFQPKNIGLNARVGYVIDGVNAGQSTSYMLGFLYQFNW